MSTSIVKCRVVRADPGDVSTMTAILNDALMTDPVSSWILPDVACRRTAHPEFMRVFVDLAVHQGEIHTTDDAAGAALWFPVGLAEQKMSVSEDVLTYRIRRACGPDADRALLVTGLQQSRHPTHQPHWYLAFVGVAPHKQGHGIGSAVLAHMLDRCDHDGVPSYLEASSARNRTLYSRLGFRQIGEPIRLPNGPSLWPMWRDPLPS